MQFEDVRASMGFRRKNEYPAEAQDTTIDIEKTYHCAAGRRLVSHVAFTLKPSIPDQTSRIWKESY
jgi:hypothetical protein